MGAANKRQIIRSSKSDRSKTQIKWLTWSNILVMLSSLLVCVVVALFVARVIPNLLADPRPSINSVTALIITVSVYLIVRMVSNLRHTVLDQLRLSEDVNLDALRYQVLENYWQSHPPTDANELDLIMEQVHQLEKHQHERAKEYVQDIDKKDDGLWEKILTWIFQRNTQK
jgi:phosphoglycerol transferase MdoB-like AlkP superfamily enzyme